MITPPQTGPGRIARRVHYLWRNMDSAGIELVSAALSLWFAVAILVRLSDNLGFGRGWALICGTAGVLKILGVLYEWRGARITGLLLGAGFWAAFATAYVIVAHGGINWGGFVILSLAQMWCLRQVVRP